MIEITVIDVESKELHKMEETKEKKRKKQKLKKKMKLSTIRIVVISETCLLIIRHKKKVMQVDPYPPMSGVRNDNIHHLQPLISD